MRRGAVIIKTNERQSSFMHDYHFVGAYLTAFNMPAYVIPLNLIITPKVL